METHVKEQEKDGTVQKRQVVHLVLSLWCCSYISAAQAKGPEREQVAVVSQAQDFNLDDYYPNHCPN